MTAVTDRLGATDPVAVRRLRAAAHRHHRAGGQRRHRQDVHDRRRSSPATSPRASPGWTSCCSSPSAARPPRSCASGSASGWSAPSDGLADPAAARAGDRPGARAARRRVPDAEVALRRRRLAAALADVRRRDGRDHAPVLPAGADGLGIGRRRDAGRGARREHRRPGRRGRRRPLRAQVRPRAAPAPRRSTAPRRCALARRAVGDRAGTGWSPPARRRQHARRSGAPFATAVRAEVDRRKRRRGCIELRRPAHPARRRPGRPGAGPAAAAGCATATGWCWSTSSRTPTRCSGTILRAAFHGHAHAGADRRPEAGDLRLPRRRRRTPTSTPPSTADAHATLARQLAQRRRAAARRWTRCSAAPRWATRGSSCVPVESAHPVPRLAGAPVDAPVRLRVVPRDGLRAAAAAASRSTPDARDAVARDLARRRRRACSPAGRTVRPA